MAAPVHDQNPARPGALSAGVIAVFAAALGALTASGMLLGLYNAFADLVTTQDASSETADFLNVMQTFSILVVIFNAVLVCGMIAGAALALRTNNVGRILIWVFGGVNTAWHWCCGGYLSILVLGLSNPEVRSSEPDFPFWQLNVAVVAGLFSGTAALVAIILIALNPVNQYFRAFNGGPPRGGGFQAPPGGPYGPPPHSGPQGYTPQPPLPPYQPPHSGFGPGQ